MADSPYLPQLPTELDDLIEGLTDPLNQQNTAQLLKDILHRMNASYCNRRQDGCGGSGTPPPAGLQVSFTVSTATPTAGQTLSFTAIAGGGTSPYQHVVTATNVATSAVTEIGRSAGANYSGTWPVPTSGTYDLKDTVTDAASGSVESVTRRVYVQAAATQLATPENLQQVASTTTTATFAWSKSPNATGYLLKFNGGTITMPGDVDTYTFTGLQPGSSFYVQVAAAASGYLTSNYSAQAPGSTQASSGFSATVDSQRNVTLTPATGTTATDYEYQFRTGPSVSADRQADLSQTLAPGESPTDYEYQVR